MLPGQYINKKEELVYNHCVQPLLMYPTGCYNEDRCNMKTSFVTVMKLGSEGFGKHPAPFN